MLLSKTVVITGAGSGIGASLCEEFARQNANLVAIDCDAEALESLKQRFERTGATITTRVVDVSDRELLSQAVDGIRFDVWINNAGIHGNGDFELCDEAFYRRVVSVNLLGVLHGTAIALAQMEKNGAGSIVNVASVSGHVSSPFMSVYSATKHGVVGFTRSLQSELKVKGSNTHVLLVSPGFVKTPLLTKDGRFTFPKYLEWTLSTPERVGKSIVQALRSRQAEVVPTWNGKVMKRFLQTVPRAAVPMARMMLSESISDYWLRRLRNP